MIVRSIIPTVRCNMNAPSALACADDEATLFSCISQDQQHTIELCAVRDDAAGGYQSLQYRYGTAEADELVFPENRRDKAAMAFAHAFDKSAYVWSLRFDNKGYVYRVFGMGEEAGVEVWRKKKRLAQRSCAARSPMLPPMTSAAPVAATWPTPLAPRAVPTTRPPASDPAESRRPVGNFTPWPCVAP